MCCRKNLLDEIKKSLPDSEKHLVVSGDYSRPETTARLTALLHDNGIEEVDSFEMGVYKKIFGDNIEVKLVKKDFGEARAASSSLQFAMLAKDIYEGKFENGIAVSFGTSALYSAVLLTKA